MSDRLTSIITKTGDDGTTGLGDGTRIHKSAPRIQAIGDVDELNSQLGLLIAGADLPPSLSPLLQEIQHRLFDLGAELSVPGHVALTQAHVERLENASGQYNDTLPPLREFVLPGGCIQAARAHVCRSVCRRAERSVIALDQQEPVSDTARHYLNRLSDYLFIVARMLNQYAHRQDIFWQKAD